MKAFLTILLASEPPVQDRECAALLCLSPGAAASWLQPSCRVACVQRWLVAPEILNYPVVGRSSFFPNAALNILRFLVVLVQISSREENTHLILAGKREDRACVPNSGRRKNQDSLLRALGPEPLDFALETQEGNNSNQTCWKVRTSVSQAKNTDN